VLKCLIRMFAVLGTLWYVYVTYATVEKEEAGSKCKHFN